MDRGARILVAGWSTVLGAALRRALVARGFGDPLGVDVPEPDWTQGDSVAAFFREHRPGFVFLVAGKVGGIQENRTHPATLMVDNLRANLEVLEASRKHGVQKLLYLASSCSYPRLCPQPMKPEALMTGPLEPTNEAYATAKLALLALVKAMRAEHGCAFISGIPGNMFGPGDDFHPATAHVIGALLHRMHEAKEASLPEVVIWGTGAARRQFVYGDDLAQDCLLAMASYDGDEPINLGMGADLSIAELAALIRETVGYQGSLRFDATHPDGMPLKSLDMTALKALGGQEATSMGVALAATYRDYLNRRGAITG